MQFANTGELITDFDRALIENTFLTAEQFNIKTDHLSDSAFSLFHLNVRGCRTNFNLLTSFLQSLKFNFTFIALTETYITENSDYNFSIPGYNCISHYSKHGIKLFCLRSLQCNKIHEMCYDNETLEALFVTLNCQALNKQIVGIVYRPHSNTINNFNDFIEHNLLNNFRRNVNYLLCGDFNINLLSYNSNENVKIFQNLLLTKNLIPSNFCVTRYNNANPENSTCLDQFWSNICIPYRTYTIESSISDHYPIVFIVDSIDVNTKIDISFRDYSKNNFDNFQSSFPNLIEQYSGNLDQPTTAVCHLNNWFLSILEKFFPIKNKTVSMKRLKSPWINDSLLVCIQKKHKFYRMSRDGIIAKEVYVKYKNVLSNLIYRSKSEYFQNSFELAKCDMAKTWKIINSLITASNKNNRSSQLRIPGSDRVTNDSAQIANIFKSHFADGPNHLINNLPIVVPSRNYDNFPSNQFSIFLDQSNVVEVAACINSFANKTNGLNDIPMKLLKAVAVEIAPILSTIFNKIIETGIYPDMLKIARVRPVFKAGNDLDVNNYRPISVLSTINKIFEKLLLTRINSFIENNNLLSEFQFGFRQKRSTADACLTLVERLQDAFCNNLCSLVIFIDLKSAFDTVNHARLLIKLERIGIRGIALNLVESYLCNRKLFVTIEDSVSEYANISSGVPQGSSLSGILFSIYINDFMHFIKEVSSILYADDTTLYKSCDVNEDLIDICQRSLNIFMEWSNYNMLTVNVNKTKIMYIAKANPLPPQCTFRINGQEIEFVESFKYLGLVIDNKLSFDDHVSFLNGKLARLTGMTFMMNNLLSIDAAKNLYFALVHSLLLYMITFWGSNTETNLNKIQSQQNRIVYNLFSRKIEYNHLSDIYKQCKILSVRNLYKLEIGKICFRALFTDRYSNLSQYFYSHNWTHSYNTRMIYQYRTPRVKTVRESRNIVNKCITIWNSIPLNIKNSVSLLSFKKRYSYHLLSRQHI